VAAAFAALETRLNRAVFARLANVDAVIDFETVPAIFDSAYTLASVGPYGMASSQPMLTLATADVPATPVGKPAVVNDIAYTIAAHEPDGTGVSRLLLEVAA